MASTTMTDRWASLGSLMASAMFVWAVISKHFPGVAYVDRYLRKYSHRLFRFFYPYIQVNFPEFSVERMNRSEAYTAIETYLSSTSSQSATRLKADLGKDSRSLTLSMDEYEEVTDHFCGAKLWWNLESVSTPKQGFSWYPQPKARRHYKLSFHRRHRDLVVSSYLDHVLREGRELGLLNRQRKLCTNNPSNDWYGYKRTVWSHVVFEHPSNFDTVAMDPVKKKEIVDDLTTFRGGKDYYAKIGKAWKRGYLLFGPPGTGKSTMIGAIANFLDYDIYDLELTSVKNNTELRKLFIETTSKSIIVIEDIDCSLDLTGQRKPKKKAEDTDADKPKLPGSKEEKEESKVTLSGLLNFIDGLWSACGGERLIIFTTNHIEKLDPALIRRGRMDKHIEMSYCCFEAFKVLAKNYLGIDDHETFDEVRRLMGEVKITPADVAENLMPKSTEDDASTCLGRLIQAMEAAKEEAEKAAAKEEAEKAAAKEEAEKAAAEEAAATAAGDDGNGTDSTVEN